MSNNGKDIVVFLSQNVLFYLKTCFSIAKRVFLSQNVFIYLKTYLSIPKRAFPSQNVFFSLKTYLSISKRVFLSQNVFFSLKSVFLSQNVFIYLKTCFSISKRVFLSQNVFFHRKTCFSLSKSVFLSQNVFIYLKACFSFLKRVFLSQNVFFYPYPLALNLPLTLKINSTPPPIFLLEKIWSIFSFFLRFSEVHAKPEMSVLTFWKFFGIKRSEGYHFSTPPPWMSCQRRERSEKGGGSNLLKIVENLHFLKRWVLKKRIFCLYA